MQPRGEIVHGREDQTLYGDGVAATIPAVFTQTQYGESLAPAIITRWTLTDEERKAIAEGRDIYLWVYSGQHPPVSLMIEKPIHSDGWTGIESSIGVLDRNTAKVDELKQRLTDATSDESEVEVEFKTEDESLDEVGS